jgi:hypothetical protein
VRSSRCPVAQEVDARVADVGDGEEGRLAVAAVVHQRHGAQGGAHPPVLGGGGPIPDLGVGVVEGVGQAGDGRVDHGVAERLDGQLGRDVTGGGPTHAVGERHHQRADERAVLVLGSHTADVGRGADTEWIT